ncbi:polyprenyl synthetase family protein [Sphingosinicella rhizophila]|uniref:Polyprenyl synthetase family protein n=1 Tax=Sphingosinicella rhizophila TaxID=3050082 RepID=A0ABU3Q7M4_9SPHN|nr:farnesyl diphosphate synthase [Sphingosinicella sp. GR2756]MDT9598978.1 polyprenyl synthetase family protein [Sphingosinicella sp. GR2756]
MLHAAAGAFTLKPEMERVAADIDHLFDQALRPACHSNRLCDAMRYAAMGGGKRMRPLLVLASASLFGVSRGEALRAGLAVEAIHVHSLIHDDLPCMDDDDLRRGKPSVHCAFDEATAVLAGDALMALAFETLADARTHNDPGVRADLIARLAAAAGPSGMAGGQMLDLLADHQRVESADIVRIQILKTGALIGWCLDAGAVMGRAAPVLARRLATYANCLGLAFQIADDLLDAEGDEAKIGKRVGKDAGQGKASFVSLFGIAGARRRADHLVAKAIRQLQGFGRDADLLRAIARYAIARDR